MKKLIVGIQLFVVLLWASTAIAAKPDSEIVLIGGPEISGPLQCQIHNRTDSDIEVTIDFCSELYDGTVAVFCSTNAPVTLVGHSSYKHPQGNVGIELVVGYSATCEVRYVGKNGDIMGQFCGAAGCVQLR